MRLPYPAGVALFFLGVWGAIYLHLALMVAVMPYGKPWQTMLAAVPVQVLIASAATAFLVPLAQRIQNRRRMRDVALLVLLLPFVGVLMTFMELVPAWNWTREFLRFVLAASVAPFSLALSVIAAVLAFLVVGREEQTARERRRFELEALWARSRAEQLRARLSPPFLFAMLEKISAATERDPDEAEETLERFAELLRSVVDLEHAGAIPLEQELEIVDRFVELSRGAGRLHLAADDDTLHTGVPPLLVYSAVAALVAEGADELRLVASSTDVLRVTISVAAPYDLKPIAQRLVPLSDRLQHLYPARETLQIGAVRDALSIDIVLPGDDDHHGTDRRR